MTQAELIRRGQILLVACVAALLVGMLASDLKWGGLFASRGSSLVRYAITGGLGLAAVRGASWARILLAGLIGVGVLYAIYTVAHVWGLLPQLSIWLSAHALLNATVAGVLALSPSIARYQSSRNELVMP